MRARRCGCGLVLLASIAATVAVSGAGAKEAKGGQLPLQVRSQKGHKTYVAMAKHFL